MADDNRIQFRLRRRGVLKTGGAGGMAAIAGCLGDDADDEPADDDTDDVADDADVPDDDGADDVDPIDDGDDADDEPAANVPDVHDAVAVWAPHDYADMPADVQYNPYVDPSAPNDFPFRGAPLIGRSNIDFAHYPHLVQDWSYQPGVLEFTLHDDFYWWSGDQVTVDDYLSELEFVDFMFGGDEHDANPDIISRERIDDLTARLTLADSWHQDWGISQSIENYVLSANRSFYAEWNELFEDAADLDAVETLREDHQNDGVIDTDEELVNLYYSPYEFRLDGSIGEVGEDYWEFELIQEKDGNLRHHANHDHFDHLPNFARGRVEPREEGRVQQTQRFQEGIQPFVGAQHVPATYEEAMAGDYDFEVDLLNFYRPPSNPGGIQFNHATHPSDDPHFRRAFAYLTDNTAWAEHPEMVPAEEYHPFFSEDELEATVSPEVIDAFTDYGYDGMQVDEAEAELEAGGYERNADGDWILQADGAEGDAGEPMDFGISTHSWMPYVSDLGSDWFQDLADFGIGNEVIMEGLPEEWTVLWNYSGGGTPEHAFGNVFLDLDWARAEYGIPSTILAPAFLETEDAPADPDDWVEYEVVTMAERLSVTTDEGMHQQLVDELAWVVNQTCNHFSVSPVAQHYALNVGDWTFPDPAETAAQHSAILFRTLHYGVCQYRG